jgi:hypothetical protein
VEVVMTPDEDRKLERQVSRPDITDPVEFKERFDFSPDRGPPARGGARRAPGARALSR